MTYKDYATFSAAEAGAKLQSGFAGLSDAVAAARLAEDGPNRLPRPPKKALVILLRQLSSPMMLVLLAAFFVSVLVKDWNSAITILAFMIVNAGLGFIQEYRSDKYVRNLEKLIAPAAVVRRGGVWKKIPRNQIVKGDLVALKPGDSAPADCRIVRSENFLVDESSLTGESVPVGKDEGAASAAPAAPFEASNILFAGTMAVSGEAEALAFETGAGTSLGRIVGQATEIKRSSIFEKNISAFTKFMVKMVVITLGVIYAANLLIKGSAADPLELLLFSMALAVSVIPEAMPVVTSVTFSRGAMILAKKKVVVKRLSAIEDLGHIEILCTDKTGTITENRLTVESVYGADADACVRAALLSSARPGEDARGASSFDEALWKFASSEVRDEAARTVPVAELPFDPRRRINSAVYAIGGRRFLSLKGAPENVLAACGVRGAESDRAMEECRRLGARGMRVLGIAQREVPERDEYSPSDETGADFLGLIGFVDPLKPSAKDAIRLAERLNVRVKIVSGDSPEVAGAIGKEIGIIKSVSETIAGPALEALDDEAFVAAVNRYDVLARITPELKHRIVSVLERDHATGFLGEGFNDAPALKSANVGIVVSDASDIAREEADVVLMDRSLAVIIDGIREGRTIYANIVKYIRYTLVANFGNFYSMAIISLFVDFLPLLPAQILLLNFVSDYPLIAIATDLVSDEDLASPHRFSVRDIAAYATMLGLVSSLFDFVFFAIFRGSPERVLQTSWFIISVLTEIISIFSLRTDRFFLSVRRPSVPLIALSLLAAASAFAIPYTAWGADFFRFVPLGLGPLAVLGLIGVFYLASTEAAKLAYARFWKKTVPVRA